MENLFNPFSVTNILATRFVRPYLIFPKLFRYLAPELYKKQQEGIAVMHNYTENIIEQRRRTLKTSPLTSNEKETQEGIN